MNRGTKIGNLTINQPFMIDSIVADLSSVSDLSSEYTTQEDICNKINTILSAFRQFNKIEGENQI